MVATESEMIIAHDEVDLSDQQQQQKNHLFSSLGRQSSIYSLTLDEFQQSLCDSGKHFGSMNMDEFLTSIWTAEENQAINATQPSSSSTPAATTATSLHTHLSLSGASDKDAFVKQQSLARQGSLTLPAPLCGKTVDEVWSEIHKGQRGNQQNSENNNDNVQGSDSVPRQPTFGEMTLEDFLVKAGVVREPDSLQSQQQAQQYGYNPALRSTFVNRPITGIGPGGGGGVGANGSSGGVPPYQAVGQSGCSIGDASPYADQNGKRNNGLYPPAPLAVCYGGRVVNGGGGYAPVPPPMGLATPLSPVSPDGMCTGQVDNSTSQYGFEMGGLRGRKRIIDGPVEKVVERRQRRMIKNRESAARSRARKQAYTVELEAELNQLREENAHLKQALADLDRKRKQQYVEDMKRVQTKAQRTKEKLRVLRRNLSGPL